MSATLGEGVAARRFSPPPAGGRPPRRVVSGDVATRLVRLALLVRLAAVVVCLFAQIGRELDNRTALAMLALATTSVLGLSNPRLIDWVVSHPLVAMVDIGIVLLVVVVLGVENPLTLAVLSTALIVGVLFSGPMSAILGVTLAAGYLLVAVSEVGVDPSFVVIFGIPVTVGCLVAVGQAIRAIEQQFEESQAQLARALRASAADEERGRLAREVHDGIAKSLQGLALGAAALPAWLERDGTEAAAHAKQLSEGAQDAVREARSLLSQLRADRPGEPFATVLEGALSDWARQFAGEVSYSGTEGVSLSTQARYELLASLREALTNIERHAPESEVSVVLRADGGTLYLVVRDKGPGFDLRSVPDREQQGHFGLRGMAERMSSVGGGASVESAPGYGTTIVLTAPLLPGASQPAAPITPGARVTPPPPAARVAPVANSTPPASPTTDAEGPLWTT